MIPGGLISSLLSAVQPLPFMPVAMQASPVGYIGSFRSVTGHNSVCMFRAAVDCEEIEITISNAVWFESGSASEAFPSDGANLQVVAVLYTPTFPYAGTTRLLTGPLAAGVKVATLQANAPGSTMEYLRLSSGERRWIKMVGSNTGISWDKELTLPATNNPTSIGFTNRGALQFNGGSPGILEGGKFSVLQASLPAPVKRGDPFYVEFYVSKVGGGAFLLPGNQPANWQDDLSNGLLESYNDSVTNSTGTRFGSAPWYNTAGGANMFRPIAVRGKKVSNQLWKSVDIFGDSISSHPVSWIQQFLHKNNVPFNNFAKAGETFGEFMNSANPVRKAALSPSSAVALILLGRNSWTLAGALSFIAYVKSLGYKQVILGTPPPITTTSNGGIDEAGQTQDTVTKPIIDQLIALVGQPTGPDRIWNVYEAVRGIDPLKWAAGYSVDMTHPLESGRAAIINYGTANNWLQDLAL
jgi:hypothetical protein